MADQLRAEFVDELRVDGINFMGFGLIPKFVMLHKDLSIESKAIYAYFASYTGAGRTAFPSRDKIISDLSITKDCYYKHLGPLKEMGFILVEAKHSHGGYGNGFANNVYTLTDKPSCLKEGECTKEEGVIKESGILSMGFGKIAKAVMVDPRLSIKEKGLLAYYSCFAGAGESACPKRETVLYHLSISESAYKKYNRTLVSCNYITVVQRRTQGSFGVNDIYINANPDTAELPRVKIQDTQNIRKDAPQVVFSDTQIPDKQKSDAQIQDTNNNKPNINSFKNNQSINQSKGTSSNNDELEGLKDSSFEDFLLGEIKKNAALPEIICEKKEYVKRSVYFLSKFDRLGEKSFFEKEEDYSIYMLFVEALIDLLSMKKGITLTGDEVSSKEIFEKLSRAVELEENSANINSVMDEARKSFKEGCKKTDIKNPLSYMKACIWTALKTGDAKLWANMLHDFPEEEPKKEKTIFEIIPDLRGHVSFFIEDYEDYKRNGNERVFRTEKQIINLLKDYGFSEDILYKDILQGYDPRK